MIKRIQNITNIGKFADCKAAGCEFGKTTVIFGKNTQGKSTLTAILRSIQTGNNDILIGRKTFGATSDKKVEIDFESSSATNDKFVFQNKSWNKQNENILIFDSKFIAENVFDGEKISYDQQKNLNTIIIGKKGQELNAEIIQLQEKSEKFTERKRDKNKEFSSHIKNSEVGTFCSIEEDKDIEQKILDKEKEIQFEKDKDAIKSAVDIYIRKFSNIKFEYKETLVKTLDVKQEEIENHIKQHFSKSENAENFLNEGLEFLKEKVNPEDIRNCVFCGQDLEASAEHLISVYSSYFKGGYSTLQKEVNEAIEYFTDLNLEAGLEKISTDLISKQIDIGLDAAKVKGLSKLKKDFEKEIKKKRDLNYKVDFTSLDELQSQINNLKTSLENIKKTKLDIPSKKPLSVLEAEKIKLELTKKRYEKKWVDFCADLAVIDKESEENRIKREEKRKELEEYSTKIFEDHKETINLICSELGADFEIADFKPMKKLVGKDERIFAIKFYGNHKVQIDGDDDRKPTFKNTLSESDKRLLAFAFFLSLLKHDNSLQEKIVVLDDPMTSFDYERRRKTIHHILDISSVVSDENGKEQILYPRQKVILTHEDRFARELKRLEPDATTLKIKIDVDDGMKCSSLTHADFTKDFPEDDISNRLENVKEILDKQDFTKSFDVDCRVIMENIFKRKYFFELKNDLASKKSVRTFVTTLKNASINGFDDDTKYKKFTRLCDDLNIELHDNSSTRSDGDKESILKDFFECLRQI